MIAMFASFSVSWYPSFRVSQFPRFLYVFSPLAWVSVMASVMQCTVEYWVKCTAVLLQCSMNSNRVFKSSDFSVVQYGAVQCSAVQCSAVQCSLVTCSAVQCGTVQYSAVKFSLVQQGPVVCSAVYLFHGHLPAPLQEVQGPGPGGRGREEGAICRS